jgi:hypothetical protein
MNVAALPDPAQPTFVLLAAGLGAFVGATIGRARRRDREEVRELAENWAYASTAFSLAMYLVLLVLDLAS